MPWSNQFSLSLELAKALPLAGIATVGAGSALIRLARDLRASGSDIVIEEDLAAIFRQNRIDPNFEEQFRKDVVAATNLSMLEHLLPISLQSGPGPTVRRALKDPAYMPLVVQMSLLCAVHDVESLSEGLAEALRLRAVDSTHDFESAIASSSALRGTLQACADQTTGFNWTVLTQEVEAALHVPRWVADQGDGGDIAHLYSALTVPILQACLDMLATVQRLYKDSILKIDSCHGCVTLVVWAHYVLGLTVHVTNTGLGTVIFGSGEPSVVIEFPQNQIWDPSSVAYLLNASGEILLQVEPEAETGLVKIDAELKISALGYAVHVFNSDECLLEPVSVTEMCHYSAALAFNFSERLFIGERNAEEAGRTGRKSFIAGNRSVQQAVEFILGPDQYHKNQIMTYCQALVNKPVEDMKPPPTLESITEYGSGRHWERLLDSAMRLSFVILAFAAIGDLSQCNSMVLAAFSNAPPYPVQARKARAPIVINYNHWFRVIGYLLTGRKRWLELDGSCLISGWGWSLYYDCLVDSEPQSIIVERIWVQRGVPHNGGSIAHRIQDGLNSISTIAPWATKIDQAGSSFKPRCAVGVVPSRFMVAHREDAFIVSKRYQMQDVTGFLSVGYLDLAAGLWDIHSIERCIPNCTEPISSENEITLGLGTATMKGFLFWRNGGSRGESSYAPLAPEERIAIALTAGNKHAEWVALVASSDARRAHEIGLGFAPNPRQPVLKGQKVCTACFVKQASRMEGSLLLIL